MRMSGDLSQRLPVNQGAGRLAHSFNQLVENFQGIVGKVISMPGGSLRPRSSSPEHARHVAEGSTSSAAPPTARCERLTR